MKKHIKKNNTHKGQTQTKNINTQYTKLMKPNYKTQPPQRLLMLCGDIEPNPGPMPNLLQNHPTTHKNRNKMYFIPCTIKLHPEYQHLATQFSLSIYLTHPNHQETITKYPHLSKYIHQNQHHPPPRILYALITTISPILETCNHILIQTPTPDWTTTLLEKMALLQNPPKRHILNAHPYTKFTQNNQDLINPTPSINKEIYKFIHENSPNINVDI